MDERFSVAGLLRHRAEAHPDAPMLTAGAQTSSWAEVLRRASAVAHALRADGVRAGDRVAFLDRNGIPHFETLFGCALAGAVHVAVNWRLAPAEVAAVLADARPSTLVVAPDHLDRGGDMLDGASRLGRVVVLDGGGPDGPSGEGRPAAMPPGAVAYEDWLADRPTSDPGHRPGAGEPVLQLYTSGTTGLPKGVMLSNANLATAMGQAGDGFGVDATTVSLVAMPLFHIGGIGWALCGMSRGGRSIILRDVDPGVLLTLVGSHRVTDTFVVPAVLMVLLATPAVATTDFSSLRTVFYGASPIAEDVLARCLERFGCRFAQLYGMTETTGAITMLAPEDHDPSGPRRHLLRSAGRPLPGVELRVVDPAAGTPVDPGTVGEVQARSPYTMLGYFQKPEESAATVTADGWMRTGDAGFLDEDGYLFLQDRIKDMVVSGGENVYPAEVENVVLSLPGVADAAVIGVPDERWGETVKAVVVPAPGAPETLADDIIAACRQRLAHFKCPTSVDLVGSLPRNASGKILKRELREPYWQGRSRHVG